jgi:hypothetical protein
VAVPLLSFARFLLGTFVKPFVLLAFYLYYKFIARTDYLRPLPRCKSRLLTLPAHKLADMIRRKEVHIIFLLKLFSSGVIDVVI